MAAGAGAALAGAILRIIGKIGDARAWRLHVRMWAHDMIATPDHAQAEVLEAWVHDIGLNLDLFGRQRREELRMWAYEKAGGDITIATSLYAWAVQGEDRFADHDDGAPRPQPRPGFNAEEGHP